MRFMLSPVRVDDAEILIRKCEYPAMLNNPLRLLMFPHSSPNAQEEEIRWAIDGLKETLGSHKVEFRKVCGEDGTPVGFAGWSIENPVPAKVPLHSGDVVEKTDGPREHSNWLPSSLDMTTWMHVSAMFRAEKKRMLHNRTDIWRLNMISVDPAYQRQGVGSMLLQWGCDEADQYGQDAYLLASPAGIRLYRKFGFETVGEVRTAKGTFTSMFREARRGVRVD